MIIPNLVSALHDGLLTQEDTWDSTKLHVSDLGITIPGEGCARSVWLRMRGADRAEPSMGKMLMFDHGHRIHERVVDVLRRGLAGGWLIAGVEVDLTPSLPLGLVGRADLILTHAEHGLRVVDFKTVRSRAFAHLRQPKPANAIQVQAYEGAADAEAGVLLYLDREGQNAAVQFPIGRDDERVIVSAAMARAMVDADEPPDVLAPVYQIEARKGADAVYRKNPWPCDYCLAPETRVLTGDLRWVPVGDVAAGDVLLGFDEHLPSEYRWRRWRPATVTSTKRIVRPSYRIRLGDGTCVVASAEHLWLAPGASVTGVGRHHWKRTDELSVGHSRIVRATEVWHTDTTREAGYIAAAFDGEGHLYQGRGRRGHRPFSVSFAQMDNEMADAARHAMRKLGITWTEHVRRDGLTRFSIGGRLVDRLRFLGSVRPERLLAKLDLDGLGCFYAKEYVEVVGLEPIGVTEVVALGTSTHTLVAEGLATHNCPYQDVACPGALAPDARAKTLVGHYETTGLLEVYTPRPGYEADAGAALAQIRAEASDDAGRDQGAAA